MLVISWITAIVVLAWVFSHALCKAGAESTTPNAVRCHYCDKSINLSMEQVKRRCPNCKDEVLYHGHCGTRLFDKEPFCDGKSVAHYTGHILSFKYPNLCAHCGLAKEFWTGYPCSPSAVESINYRTKFTAKDEAWLHDLRISIKEEIPTAK